MMKAVLKIFRKDTPLVLLLFVFSFALRVPFAASWLEDWDSVQFALGMHQFSVVDHQPHPPGYPLYILLGRLFLILFQDDTKALTFLSCLLGAALILPLYFLAKRMFNRQVALIASLITMVLPVEWVLSETPVSNIPGLFFLLIFGYLAYVYGDNIKKIIWVGFFAGIILGIRFTDFAIVLSILGLLLIKRHNLKYSILLLTSFIVGLSIWLLPTIILTGPSQFFQALREIGDYVMWHDTLLGQSYPFDKLLITRLKLLRRLLETSYTSYFLIISFISSLWIIKNIRLLREFSFQLLGIWLLSYGTLLIFYFNLELPQYNLPLLPPLVIMTAVLLSSIFKAKKFHWPGILLLVALLVVLAKESLVLIYNQFKQTPPTIAPVLYVKNNFNPAHTTLITTFTYRQFQYYAPEFVNYYVSLNKPKIINTEYVVIDYQGLKDQLSALNNYHFVERRVFENSQLKFPRLSQTKLYILRKINQNISQ